MKKKLVAFTLLLGLSLGVSATETNTVDPNVRATELIQRVQHIRSMKFDEMSSDQKSAVKEELKDIRVELKELKSTKGLDNKVTLSVGAIIIIILLLILIL